MTADLDFVRASLTQRPQCSVDYEADAEFAEARGIAGDPQGLAHRRRVAALGDLVKLGEADTWWTGLALDAGWHGPRRAKMYARRA
jgi:hypothetical protein